MKTYHQYSISSCRKLFFITLFLFFHFILVTNQNLIARLNIMLKRYHQLHWLHSYKHFLSNIHSCCMILQKRGTNWVTFRRLRSIKLRWCTSLYSSFTSRCAFWSCYNCHLCYHLSCLHRLCWYECVRKETNNHDKDIKNKKGGR